MWEGMESRGKLESGGEMSVRWLDRGSGGGGTVRFVKLGDLYRTSKWRCKENVSKYKYCSSSLLEGDPELRVEQTDSEERA